jgi:hypothetical protein
MLNGLVELPAAEGFHALVELVARAEFVASSGEDCDRQCGRNQNYRLALHPEISLVNR